MSTDSRDKVSPRGEALVLLVLSLWASGARADFIDHFATGEDIGLLKVPNRGEVQVVVIPVVVDDLPFAQADEAAFLAEIEAFFAPEAEGWAFTPYWETQSLGRYRPVATVAEPVRFPSCPPIGDYQDCEIPRGGGIAEGNLQAAAATLRGSLFFLDQILRCAQSGPGAGLDCTAGSGVDLALFDTAGLVPGTPDGFVDGVLVVSNAGFPGITLPVQELSTNALFTLLGPLPSFAYGAHTVGAVAIAGRAAPPQHEVWVSVHEFGHLLGFADLYDETGATTDMPYTVLGGWYYWSPAPSLDPFSRLSIGWGHAVQVIGDGTFELGPVDRTGTVLKIGTGDEFFTVELRRRIAGVLDDDLGVEAGVVVERVRLQQRPSPERGQYLNTLQECVNCIPYDSFLTVEQADGLFQLERGLERDDEDDMFLAGDEIAPSDDVEPRSATHAIFSTNRLDGAATGVTIRVLEVSPESATVEILAPPVADACAEIAPYCGELPCTDGECGRVVVPEVPPPECQGCCCEARRGSASGAAAGALALLGLMLLQHSARRRQQCCWRV